MLILPAYSYYNDLLTLASENKPWPLQQIWNIGGRFSGKTFDTGAFVTQLCNLQRVDVDDFVKASAIIYRKQRKDRDDVYEQFNKFLADTILEQGVEKKDSRYTWYYENGNEVRFDYTESKSKGKKYGKGKASISGDYIVVILEEASEFEQKEQTAILESVRGDNPTAQILLIALANPENPRNWFIKKSSETMRFDIDIMSKTGRQYGIFDLKNEFGIPKKTLIYYTNWRAIQRYEKILLNNGNFRYVAKPPYYISQDKLDFLVTQYSIDKMDAMVADLGCPGSDLSAIFLREMEKIYPSQMYLQEYARGGVDPGFGKVKGSGFTGAVFTTYDLTGNVNCHCEYVWDNKFAFKNPQIQAEEIVQFYIIAVKQYVQTTGANISYQCPVIIYCDYSDKAFIQMLNDTAVAYGIDYLDFRECIKYELIDRVNIFLYLIAKYRVFISPLCKVLLDELYSAMWDTESAKPKIKGGNDHLIDSLFYSLQDFLFNSINDEDKSYLISKLSPRGKKMI